MAPLLLQALLALLSLSYSSSAAASLFTEYIGAEYKSVTFSDVPINSNVDFHFILAFAIDYTPSNPTPTNGQFSAFWDTGNLTPDAVSSIKQANGNVKVALSVGGATVDGNDLYFTPTSVDTWVGNAVSSLTAIIQQYNLDGIDIDYEKFSADPDTFADCIGQLVTALKNNGVIQFASIAPFDDAEVQSHYQALWNKYRSVIDYVNFQFYAYDSSTTVSQFLEYYDNQIANYPGGDVLVSFATLSGGLRPDGGFFDACNTLKSEGKLQGIFVWCADDSKSNGFQYEQQAQSLLASAR